MSLENSEPYSTVQPRSGDAAQSPPDLPDPFMSRAEPSTSKPKPWLITVAVLLVAVIGGGVAWQAFSKLLAPPTGPGQRGPMVIPVTTTPVKSAAIADSSDYIASLQSRQSVTLQPRVAGQVSQIYVRAGDFVEAGTVVLQIDPTEQQAAVENRIAAVATSEAEVKTAQAEAANARSALQSLQAQRVSRLADVQFNQQELKRFQELYAQGASSKQVLDQRVNSLQIAQANLQQVDADIQAQQATIARSQANIVRERRSLDQAEANVAQQQAQLNYYTIKAPFSGVVGDIPIKVGDFASTTTPLLSITQNKELEIQLAVPIENAPKLRKGLPVQLLDEAGKTLQTGKVFFISPNVDPQTQSVLVKAVFDNSSGKLRTSQFVRARLIWKQEPDGLAVPVTALSRLAGQNFVFVAEPYSVRCKAETQKQGAKSTLPDNHLVASQRPVKLGKILGNDQEVLEGLRPDAQIIPEGILQLRDCLPITDQPPTPPGQTPQQG
ncbi:MAG: efflux RND transporter periplasmic adaptor subunit [Leptolyngbyaceae bacterium]|nr:efflux RND transporter periplasmic adaptor subunit [Leptolyngbyaceae bacterium]